MRIENGERVRMILRVKATTPLREPARVRTALEDTGFRDVVVSEVSPLGYDADAPRFVVTFPEWLAFVDATWGAPGTDLAEDLGNLEVLSRGPAPLAPPSPHGAPSWAIPAAVTALALLAWALRRRAY